MESRQTRTAAPDLRSSPVASRSRRAPRTTASAAVRSASPAFVRRRRGDWQPASTSSQSATDWAANPAQGPSGSVNERA